MTTVDRLQKLRQGASTLRQAGVFLPTRVDRAAHVRGLLEGREESAARAVAIDAGSGVQQFVVASAAPDHDDFRAWFLEYVVPLAADAAETDTLLTALASITPEQWRLVALSELITLLMHADARIREVGIFDGVSQASADSAVAAWDACMSGATDEFRQAFGRLAAEPDVCVPMLDALRSSIDDDTWSEMQPTDFAQLLVHPDREVRLWAIRNLR